MENGEKRIIALAGEMGSGKGTVAHYLVDKYRFSKIRMSDTLRDILDRLHLEVSRESMSKASLMIRETFGQDILSRVIADDANAISGSVVIDGVRREEDIAKLTKEDHFSLVYIDVDERTRYDRLVSRAENSGDDMKTFEEFQSEQNMEADSRIQALRNQSVAVIRNNGDISDLYTQIDALIEKLYTKQ